MLTQQELLHYSRHIILPQIDEQGQQKLKQASVLVVGMGGLGAPVAMYLAAAGIGKLIIADGDRVESSNLQRQVIHSQQTINEPKVASAKAFIEQLNPFIKVAMVETKLQGDELDQQVKLADVVIDCSDNFSTRFDVNRSCLLYQKPLVSGAAIRFEGQFSVFNLTPQSPCYQCLYQPDIQLDENCMEQGVLSPVVGTIGTLQATETLKIITGAGKVADGKLVIYDALNSDFRQLTVAKDSACRACS